MQEGCYDYYQDTFNSGCCLKCSKAYPGCLCFECNCKKCYWYNELGDGSGECEKKYELIIEKKKKFMKSIFYEVEKSNLLLKKRKEYYKGKKGDNYSCQKCGYIFPSDAELRIERGKTPVCIGCENKIILTKEEKDKLQETAEIKMEDWYNERENVL